MEGLSRTHNNKKAAHKNPPEQHTSMFNKFIKPISQAGERKWNEKMNWRSWNVEMRMDDVEKAEISLKKVLNE